MINWQHLWYACCVSAGWYAGWYHAGPWIDRKLGR